MTEEINSTNNSEHSVHAIITQAKKTLKSMHENQTELDKNNPEFQSTKEDLAQLLEIEPADLTPQEFTSLVELVTKAQEMTVIKTQDTKTDV